MFFICLITIVYMYTHHTTLSTPLLIDPLYPYLPHYTPFHFAILCHPPFSILSFLLFSGTNEHEGNVFVFSAFTSRMSKIFYQTCVFGFFHASAPSVLKRYAPLARKVDESPYPDYRLVLSEIIGDYLFRCPNRLFANRLSMIKNPVFLYEFSLQCRVRAGSVL